MKTYTFHVSIPGTGRVWRKIEMRADQTLETLHRAIQRAYAWGGDHLYSFFMSGKAWDTASEYCLPEGVSPWGEYIEEEEEEEKEEEELPELTPEEREQELRELYGDTDMTLEEMEADLKAFFEEYFEKAATSGPGDVRTTTVGELGLRKGQTFMYLFDYGDEWRFNVRVHAINENAPEDMAYPRIVESVGEAPEQYPSWE